MLIYSEIFFKLMYIIVYINVERDEGPKRKRELMKNYTPWNVVYFVHRVQ